MLCSCNAQKEVEQPNNSDESVAKTVESNKSNLPTSEATEPKAEYKWKDEYTINELVDAINESSLEPLEEYQRYNEDGSFNQNIPGSKMPLKYLRRANESLIGKTLTLSLCNQMETIVVFYEKNDTREERTVVIVPGVMLVLESDYGSVKNFVDTVAYSRSFKVLSSKIMETGNSSHSDCLLGYRFYKENKNWMVEDDPELDYLEFDYTGDVCYAFYGENGFEYFNHNMWLKIYGEDEPVSGLFERTYERFSVKELILGE